MIGLSFQRKNQLLLKTLSDGFDLRMDQDLHHFDFDLYFQKDILAQPHFLPDLFYLIDNQ